MRLPSVVHNAAAAPKLPGEPGPHGAAWATLFSMQLGVVVVHIHDPACRLHEYVEAATLLQHGGLWLPVLDLQRHSQRPSVGLQLLLVAKMQHGLLQSPLGFLVKHVELREAERQTLGVSANVLP